MTKRKRKIHYTQEMFCFMYAEDDGVPARVKISMPHESIFEGAGDTVVDFEEIVDEDGTGE